LIGHSLDVLHTGLPTLAVVHDVYPFWPILHRDFGDPALPFDAAQRAADLRAVSADFEFANRDAMHWRRLRDATAAAMQAAHVTLVAPSRTALMNLLRLAPELAALPQAVVPHGLAPWAEPPAPIDPPSRPRLRLVVPGRVRRGKGADLLRAALPGLREQAEIFLLGAGAEGHEFFGERDVHVLLDYRRDELPGLIARLQPDAALLLPTVAETFSYTLSECLSLDLPVIGTRVGALAERLIDGSEGFLADPSAEAVIATVARLAADRAALARVRAVLRQHAPRDLTTMAAEYRALLDARPCRPQTPNPAPPALLEKLAEADRLAAAQSREQDLRSRLTATEKRLEARTEWALDLERERRRAVAALRRSEQLVTERTRWAEQLNADLDTLREQLDTLREHLAQLDMEIENAWRDRDEMRHQRDAILHERDLMLGSLSWRLTRPLRSAKVRWRTLRTRLAFQTSRLANLARRGRGSLARRGVIGTLQRLLREFSRPAAPPAPIASAPGDVAFAAFRVPTSDAPCVSIVIPVYNKFAYTQACLKSLAEHAGRVPFEVIVVDDGSRDETPERLAEIDGIRAIHNAENLGFVGTCNAGAAAARGEFVLFLNNDTVVTPGWLEALVCCFEEEPDAGLVGAKLVYPDGRLQEAGGIVFRDGSGWNYGRFDDPADPRYNFRREADYVSGAAILLRRALFERLGGFDSRYAPAYYEDTDLAFAVRAAGYKVYYEPRATVIHFEGITSGTDTASGVKRYQVVNREKFLAKWQDALAPQPAPIDDARDAPRAATFRAKKRILIIDACTPTPDQDSGSLRMVNLMRLLRALGWQVTFFAENRAWVAGYTERVQSLGVEVQYHPWLADPIAFFRRRGGEFDAILLSRHYIAINYLGLARLYAPRAKLVFDTVDLHYLRERRAAELAGDADLARRAEATRAQEQKLMRECDVTLVVSPVEQKLLAQELPQVRVEILSNVHEVYGCRQPFEARRDLVFVGSFQHPPNEDAVIWFAREIFPKVREALPDVRFHVLGGPVPESIQALAGGGIEVHGFVSDLAPFMDGCRVSVAPLRYGAGVKGKVNMAMSYGLPVVATPIAVEGMALESERDALVAEGPADYAAAVVRLYRDPDLWSRLSAAGLANVTRHFSFDAAQANLARILG